MASFGHTFARRRVLSIAGLAFALLAPAGPVTAQSPTAVVRLEAGSWSAGEHPLGRGAFRPANVLLDGGHTRLLTPAGTRDGGEVQSRARYRFGRFRARMRCATPRGTLCAFFLYEGVPGDRNDEIDVEVLAGTGEVWLTTWQSGKQTGHVVRKRGLIGHRDSRVLEIEWRRGHVNLAVDGTVIATIEHGVPDRPMLLMANAWWPDWLKGEPTGGALELEDVSVLP